MIYTLIASFIHAPKKLIFRFCEKTKNIKLSKLSIQIIVSYLTFAETQIPSLIENMAISFSRRDNNEKMTLIIPRMFVKENYGNIEAYNNNSFYEICSIIMFRHSYLDLYRHRLANEAIDNCGK